MAKSPFLLRTEHGPFARGETQVLPGLSGVVCVAVPLVMALIAVVFLWIGAHSWYEARSPAQNRLIAFGTVTSQRVNSSIGMVDLEYGIVHSDEEHLVTYRFEANGPGGKQALQREAAVSESDYKRLQPGALVKVTYDRNDPAASRISEEVAPERHVVFIAVGGAMSIASVSTGLTLGAIWWKRRRLERDGQRLPGKLVSCTTRKDDEGGLLVDFTYRFVTPRGREIASTVTSGRKDWTEATVPTPDTPVVVLYLTDNIYELL